MPQLLLPGKKIKRKFDYQRHEKLLSRDGLLGNPDARTVSSLASPSLCFCGPFFTVVFAFPEPVLYLTTEGKLIFSAT